MEKYIEIGGRLHSTATGNVVTGANEILDDELNKKQSQINSETLQHVESIDAALQELSPDQTQALALATDVNTLKAKSVRSDETQSLTDAEKEQAISNMGVTGVYDISGEHPVSGHPKKYSTLPAALADVPVGRRKSGMSVKALMQLTQEMYHVEVTEGVTDLPTGYNEYELSEASSMTTGDYTYNELDTENFSAIPSTVGASVLYYIYDSQSSSYTTWLLTKSSDSTYAYKQYLYMQEYANTTAGNTAFLTAANWQGVDDEPTAGSDNLVKSGGVKNELALGAVYDVSAKKPTAGPNNDGKFESLSALLSDANLNTLIPTAARKGGMSIKFIQSSDNKYVQYRLIMQSFSTNTKDWRSVNENSIYSDANIVNTPIKPLFVYDALINTSGVKTASTIYKCTDFIRVYPYQKLKLSGNGSLNVLLISCYSTANESSFINTPVNVRGNNGQQPDEFETTIQEGINYIRICCDANIECSFMIQNAVMTDYQSIREASGCYDKLINGGTYAITTPYYGFVKNDGTINETSTIYKKSGLIPVYEGQAISISAKASTTVLVVSAFSGYSFDTFIANSPINLAGNGTENTYSFTVPSGVKAICISRDSTSVSSSTITYSLLKGIIGDLKNINDYLFLERQLVTFPYGAIVNLNGGYVTSSSYSLSDFIPVVEGQRLNFESYGSVNVLILSAYSNNVQSSFLPSSALNIRGNNSTIDIDVVIPSGVNYVRICKDISYTDNIYIDAASLHNELKSIETALSNIDEKAEKSVIQLPTYKFKSTSPRKACIAFQMDWGYRAGVTCMAYKNILAQYGVKNSLYAVQPSFFEQDLGKMLELYQRGDEIALHTDAEHASINTESTLTVSEFKALMGEYHQEMMEAGFEDYTGCVVLRVNLKDDFFEPISKCHNWTIAGAVDIDVLGSNYLSTVMNLSSNHKFPMRLGVELTPEQAAVPENITAAINRTIECIDNAVANNGFLIVYCHSYNNTTAVYTLLESVLVPVLQHLQPLLEKGQCLTGRTSDLLEYYYSKRFGES